MLSFAVTVQEDFHASEACRCTKRKRNISCTFILSMQASIFSCSTAFLAWEMLAVLLLAMLSFMLCL